MNKSAKKKLGILVCGHSPEEMVAIHGDYGQRFIDFLGLENFDFQVHLVVDNEFPKDIHQADAWLLTGSKHGVYEDHIWIAPLEQFVRDAYAANIPLVGICFGHQLLAQALGGKVEKFDGGWATGRMEYNMDESTLGTRNAALLAWHQDQVVELPPAASVIGSNDFCRYAALAYDNNKALSIQAHPEFDDDFVSDLLDTRGGDLPKYNQEHIRNSIGKPLSNGIIADNLVRFLTR